MDELLEILAKRSNCFISDLRAEVNYLKVKNVLITLNETNYSLVAWKDAYYYMIGVTPVGDTVSSIKLEMIQHLQKK